MFEFRYTKHSEEKLLERKLSKSMVEDAIKNPHRIDTTRFGRKIANKIIDGKVLRVIYEQYGNLYIVVTVYYIMKDRY